MKLFSVSTMGFYDPAFNFDIPEDAVEIGDALHVALLEGQSLGKVIAVDETGMPILQDRPAPTPEEIEAIALVQRDHLLLQAGKAIAPLQDAVDIDDASDAEVALLKKWKQYRVALMRLPDSEGWPNSINWPQAPA